MELGAPKRAIRIGVVVYHLSSHYALTLCSGIRRAAGDARASVFLFPGASADDDDSSGMADAIYRYAALCRPDVMIVSLGSIAAYARQEGNEGFLAHFAGIPTIVLENIVPGYRCLTADNVSGFTALLNHLITDHGYRLIGYLDGKENNADARQRRQLFTQTMQAAGLPTGAGLIARGDFNTHCEKAVAQLLDDNPGLEAICCANDDMAIGTYRELQRRGLIPGKDIAITGFDDSPQAACIHPPLTTVRASTYALGYAAVQEAFALLQGKQQQHFTVPSAFIRRCTCGCPTMDDAVGAPILSETMDDTALLQLSRRMLSRIALYDLPQDKTQEALIAVLALVQHLSVNTALETRANFSVEFCLAQLHQLAEQPGGLIIRTDSLQAELNNLCQALMKRLQCHTAQVALWRLLSRMNQYLSSLAQDALQAENERLRHSEVISSRIMADALHTSDYAAIQAGICANVCRLGARSCYLFCFSTPVSDVSTLGEVPSHLVASCRQGGEACTFSQQDSLSPSDWLSHPALPSGQPLCASLFCLATEQEQYGVLLCEGDLDYFQSFSLAASQASAALKYLDLIKQRAEMLQTISAKNEILQQLSVKDELTGILNRRGFMDQFHTQMSAQSGKPGALFFLDLNSLKIINDTFGHSAGDFALTQLCHIVQAQLAPTDVFGRIGGDEFALFRIIEKEAIAPFVQSLKGTFAAQDLLCDKPYHIGAAIGATSFVCSPSSHLSDLLQQADDILYEEKAQPRPSVIK